MYPLSPTKLRTRTGREFRVFSELMEKQDLPLRWNVERLRAGRSHMRLACELGFVSRGVVGVVVVGPGTHRVARGERASEPLAATTSTCLWWKGRCAVRVECRSKGCALVVATCGSHVSSASCRAESLMQSRLVQECTAWRTVSEQASRLLLRPQPANCGRAGATPIERLRACRSHMRLACELGFLPRGVVYSIAVGPEPHCVARGERASEPLAATTSTCRWR